MGCAALPRGEFGIGAGVIVIVIALTTATARPQIVNAQGALARPPAGDGALGRVELGTPRRGSITRANCACSS